MPRMLGAAAVAALATMIAVASPAAQAGTIYNLTYIIPPAPTNIHSGYVQGTITTNGKVGELAISDILAWNLHVSVGVHDQDFSEANSDFYIFENVPFYTSGITATASDLFFDFAHQGGFELDTKTNPGNNCGTGPTFCIVMSFTGDPSQGTADIENDATYPGWVTTEFLLPPSSTPVRLASEGRFVDTTPIPGTLPLLLTALGGLGLVGRRRSAT